MHAYDLVNNEWRQITSTSGHPPSPRHSHSAVIYRDSLFVFGGYDGNYRCDFNAFNFLSESWRPVSIHQSSTNPFIYSYTSQVYSQGEVPRARYRGTCVVCGDVMILHGGHDGNRHLHDTHIFDFLTNTWSLVNTEGNVPYPRDSHIAVIYNKSMLLYGGSTGK